MRSWYVYVAGYFRKSLVKRTFFVGSDLNSADMSSFSSPSYERFSSSSTARDFDVWNTASVPKLPLLRSSAFSLTTCFSLSSEIRIPPYSSRRPSVMVSFLRTAMSLTLLISW